MLQFTSNKAKPTFLDRNINKIWAFTMLSLFTITATCLVISKDFCMSDVITAYPVEIMVFGLLAFNTILVLKAISNESK